MTQLKKILFVISFSGISFLAVIIFFSSFNWFALCSQAKYALAAGSPVKTKLVKIDRLRIPAININIPLEQVGLTTQGAVDVPRSPISAAWFNLGPRPGDNGSAVVVGHYGRWKNGLSGAFNNLSKLRQGDKIYIENAKGSTTIFVVRERKSYDPQADAYDVFNSDDDKPHLNLITCEGAWDKVSKSYSKRLVIFADKQ